jgi:hypothetical protein
VFDPQGSLEARLERGPVAAGGLAAELPAGGLAEFPASGLPRRRSLDVVVPAPVLGLVLVGGLVALSVVAAYLYYPDLPTCLEDLRFVESEAHAAVLAGDRRRTEVWIAAWEDLIRRTEVGIWIRRGTVRREMTIAAEALRERIEALEHAVLDPEEIDRDHVAAILKQVLTVSRAHRDALRPAFASARAEQHR